MDARTSWASISAVKLTWRTLAMEPRRARCLCGLRLCTKAAHTPGGRQRKCRRLAREMGPPGGLVNKIAYWVDWTGTSCQRCARSLP